jgi:hypothetical protein
VTPTGAVAWYAEGFTDRFGDRLLLFDNAGPGLELLRFNAALTAVDGFEASVRARVEECAGSGYPSFATVRSLTMLDDPRPQLALVSEHAPGERLSAVLRTARQAGSRLHPDSAIWLLRQVTPALAAFQEQRRGSAHGCLTPDRIVITPMGDAIVTEYVLGPALERLNLDRRALWREFGIFAGADGAPALLGPRVDVVQLGLMTLALLLGRPLRHDDLPGGLAALIDCACAAPEAGRTHLRQWIERALGVAAPVFGSAREAADALDALMPGIAGRWTPVQVPDGPDKDSQALSRPPASTTAGLARGRAPAGPRRALPAHKGDPVVVVRRLRRVSVTLGAVALAEAAALLFLLTRPAHDIAVPAAARVASARAESRSAPPDAARPPLASAPAVATAGSMRGRRRTPQDSGGAATPSNDASPTAAAVIGWIAVQSDVEMRVYANGRLLGSAANARFRLPAGDHDITLVNDSTGSRSTQPVRIVGGRTALVIPPAP